MSPTISILVALIAFFAGVAAQWLSHHFTESREMKKHYVESYQKLYAPILGDVISFLEMRTHFQRGHDVNEEEEQYTQEKIMEHIGSNLTYASPNMIASYHEMKVKDLSDQTGFYPSFGFLGLMNVFFDEIDHIVKKSQSFSMSPKSQYNPLTKYKILYALWQHLTTKGSEGKPLWEDGAIGVMAYKWYFDDKEMTEKNYKKLIRLFKSRKTVNVLGFCTNNLITTDEEKKGFLEAVKYVLKTS